MKTSFLKYALGFGLLLSCAVVHADNTDIASTPIVTSSTADVRPNFVFVLDDSGSMDFDFLPDWVNYGDDASYCKDSTGRALSTCCPHSSNGRCLEYKSTAAPFDTGSSAQRGYVPFLTSSFNHLYYDPSIVYTPPRKADGSSYPTQNDSTTSTWTSVAMDAYNVQDDSTHLVNLTTQYPDITWCDSSVSPTVCTYNNNDYVEPNSLFKSYSGSYGAPYYYAIIPGEYCDSASLKNCTVASAPSGAYTQPAYIRWCSDSALTNCQALRNSIYTYARYATVNPNQNNAVLYTVSGSTTDSSNKSTSVTSISVAAGTAVVSSATGASKNVDALTDLILAKVDTTAYQVTTKSCSSSSGTRSCKFLVIAKYNATCPSGATTVSASSTGSTGTAIAVGRSPTSFTGNCPVPGSFTRVDIVSGVNSYTYPGLTTKHPNRSDCAGTTCTYAEEMTNFANWYTYDRTRMQMMKSSASLAFNSIDDTYRVGYFSINNNTNTDFLNIATFDDTQKTAWYNKLFSADPGNGTPLRSALSTAGLLYAGVLDGVNFNGTKVVDPVEYSCQKNYTLLSTDGYWNTGKDSACSGRNGQGCQTDKTSPIGNADGTAVRPYSDGQLNNETFQTVTTGPSTTTTVNKVTQEAVVYQRDSYLSPIKGSCSSGKKLDQWYQQQMTTTTVVDKNVTTTNTGGTTLTQTYVNGVLQSSTPSTTPSTTVNTTINSSSSSSTTWSNSSSLLSSSSCTKTSDLHSSGDVSTPVPVSDTTTTLSGPTTLSSSTDPTTTTTGPTSISTSTSGGTSDTLADVAYYYYQTDLRANGSIGALGTDVGTDNNVKAGLVDTASYQHMTTFTLGLGVDGYMQYVDDYATAASGDYFDIKNAQLASATNCTWQVAGSTCNWPVPASDSQANIDDLWHAAVNGRGTYFSAKNPSQLSASLSQVLTSVKAVPGASAAATTSTPTITSGDNFLFSSTFVTQDWTGELARYQINTTTGDISSTADWTAATLLDGRTSASADSRIIYMFNSDSSLSSACGGGVVLGSKLKPFCWTGTGSSYGPDTSLTPTEQTYFDLTNINTLTQSCATTTYTDPSYGTTRNCLSATDKTNAAGKGLVSFLRGQRGNEDTTAANPGEYFRPRAHVLGDFVSSESVYVKAPQRNYSDSGFTAFQAANASRKAMVYISGNDGMLHAFNATSGQEEWAYIPSMVLPKLYKLADVNYLNDHKYFVDGSVVVRDAYIGGVWKTMLVGGLGAGGNGFYALDITDPNNPKAMWEFSSRSSSCAATPAAAIGDSSDCDLGLSFGNPVVSKLANGTWAVLVTSGYNNTGSGSGEGFLYVLDAGNGTILNKIGTGAGSTGASGTCTTTPCPSGLAKISAWVNDVQTDNTADRIYGGDLFGNVWRFDINDEYGPTGTDAFLVAQLIGPNGAPQPITSKIALAQSGSNVILLVGTGRYLGLSDAGAPDMKSPNFQSFWGLRDNLSDAAWVGWGNIRAQTPAPVKQTLTNATDPVTGAAIRLGTANPVDLTIVPGWYIDLPDDGERVNTDPLVVFNSVVFTSNVPLSSACTTGGNSYLNMLNYSTGAPPSVDPTTGKGTASYKNTGAESSRPTVIQLDDGKGSVKICMTLSDGTNTCDPGPDTTAGGALKRVSWRLLPSDD